MTEQLWHYIDAAGSQCGPITIPQLQELVAQGIIIPETMVWTEALADQWIPASNVEGLFESVAAAMAAESEPTPPPPSAVAGETLRTNVAAAPTVVEEPQQPPLAPTTPMIASTPTTQPVTATAVAPTPMPSPAPAPAPVPSAVAEGGVPGIGQLGSEVAVPAAEEESEKKKNPLGLICILLGLIVAGVGGWFMYDQGKSTLAISLLSGGGVLLLLGIVLACRGGKSKKEVPAVAAGSSLMGIGGASATASPGSPTLGAASSGATVVGAAGAGSPGVVSLDALSSNDAAPVPLTPKANTNPLQSPKVATVKPNPLLANPDALRPANRLNTSLSAKPVAVAKEEENEDA